MSYVLTRFYSSSIIMTSAKQITLACLNPVIKLARIRLLIQAILYTAFIDAV